MSTNRILYIWLSQPIFYQWHVDKSKYDSSHHWLNPTIAIGWLHSSGHMSWVIVEVASSWYIKHDSNSRSILETQIDLMMYVCYKPWHTHTYIYIYIHIYVYIYMYIYMYTYICIYLLRSQATRGKHSLEYSNIIQYYIIYIYVYTDQKLTIKYSKPLLGYGL